MCADCDRSTWGVVESPKPLKIVRAALHPLLFQENTTTNQAQVSLFLACRVRLISVLTIISIQLLTPRCF